MLDRNLSGLVLTVGRERVLRKIHALIYQVSPPRGLASYLVSIPRFSFLVWLYLHLDIVFDLNGLVRPIIVTVQFVQVYFNLTLNVAHRLSVWDVI